MIDGQRRGYADTAVAQPGFNGAAALVEGHSLPGLVAECSHRDGAQLFGGQGVADAIQVQVRLQQAAQGAAVEQRHWRVAPQAQQAMADEAAGLAYHPRPVAAQHQVAAKVLPERSEVAHGFSEAGSAAGEGDRIDGAGRRADNDRKGVGCAGWQQLGNAGQYADLIGGTGAAARENQASYWGGCHVLLPRLSAGPASSRGKPAPTGSLKCQKPVEILWERACSAKRPVLTTQRSALLLVIQPRRPLGP
ncbi:hypothetical protein D3C81_1329260 [compost metagenome]